MPSTSILHKSLDAIKTAIQALTLSGLEESTNVLIQKVPRDLEKDLPASSPYPFISIAPGTQETLNPNGGTNLKDHVVYPIQVWILAKDNGSQTSDFDTYLYWREQIRRRFTNCRLTGVDEVERVTVQAGPIVDHALWTGKGLYASGLVILVATRETRG